MLNIDVSPGSSISNQTGLGILAGLAGKYDFASGISLFINPYLKMHSLLPMSTGNYHQRVLESGFRAGVTYDLLHSEGKR